MKIVIIGGSGLIGSKLSNKLRQLGHEVIAASPTSGVNTITGEGLDDVLKETQVVVDVANSPSFEDAAVMEFFQTAGRNLLAAEVKAGVSHHIALSVVGSERLPDSGYLRAKVAQEKLIKESPVPYSILHSTQFFEFVSAIAQAGTTGNEVHISTGAIQPIASDDVVDALLDITLGAPLNGVAEVGGPVRMPMSEFIGNFLTLTDDPRILVPDQHAKYFGTEINEQSLVPADSARKGVMQFQEWFATQYKKQEAQK